MSRRPERPVPGDPAAVPTVVSGVDEAPVDRPGARVLLLDAAGRVLLFRGVDPARPGSDGYWFTVGGGLGPGESPAEGAVREMHEETGLRVPVGDLIGPVFHEVAIFPFGGRWFRQEQDFFVVRVSSWEVAPTFLSDDERRSLTGHRWWSAEEIDGATEPVYPACLAELLRALEER